jgi:hypothetical protein
MLALKNEAEGRANGAGYDGGINKAYIQATLHLQRLRSGFLYDLLISDETLYGRTESTNQDKEVLINPLRTLHLRFPLCLSLSLAPVD